MIEQQYTCPKCFKNYTRFTIAEHYRCGVDPLVDEEKQSEDMTMQEYEQFRARQAAKHRPKINVDAVVNTVENMARSGLEADFVHEIPVEPVVNGEPAETEPKYTANASEIMESALMQAGFSSEDAAQKAHSEELYALKPEPKKRGRPAKAK
jgi:hypothetical protein